jgi:toxin ParE2
MKIVYVSEAQQEINDAVDYLIQKSAPAQVVDSLQADIRGREVLILQFPNASPPIGGGLQRCLLQRHVYQIVYRIEQDAIRVYAFAHLSRRPNYWRKRVPILPRKPGIP